jgi:hypothetical protein
VRVTTAYLRQYRFGSLCYRPQNDGGKFSLSHPPTRGVSTVINALISGFGYHKAGQHIAGGQRPTSHSLHPSHLTRYPVPVRLVPLSLSPLGFRPAASAVSVGRLRPTRRAWSAGTGPIPYCTTTRWNSKQISSLPLLFSNTNFSRATASTFTDF